MSKISPAGGEHHGTNQNFEVAWNAEMLPADGSPPRYEMGLSLLTGDPRVRVRRLARAEPMIESDQLRDVDALILGAPAFTARSLSPEVAARLILVARFGVGYDAVDVQAATAAGVMVTITRGVLDNSVAESALALMLAVSHRMVINDRAVREGRWHIRTQQLGSELRGRVIGIVGLGGIGRALARLLGVFGPARLLGCDPVMSAQAAAELGVELVGLDALLSTVDIVSLHCPGGPTTHHLLDARRLALLKPTAIVINTARGSVIDQQALAEALAGGRLAAAGLDVLESEPPAPDDPLLKLDNVVLSPHANSLTSDSWAAMGRAACGAALAVLRGQVPATLVNPEVLEHHGLRAKCQALANRWRG